MSVHPSDRQALAVGSPIPVVYFNEAKLPEEERKLLVELREIEADPKLQKQAKEVAENWKSYGFTECPVPELD